MEFPVVMLVRFWANHHLLDILQRPLWRVVRGRSRAYVDRIVAGMLPGSSVTDTLHLHPIVMAPQRAPTLIRVSTWHQHACMMQLAA